MQFETFSLKDRKEVESFEKLLSQYVTQRAQFALSHISLTNVYDAFQEREDGGRLFTAILDIQINFMLLHCDSHSVGATWNKLFSKGKLEGGSVLDSPDKFFGKMDIHRFNTSYILRYRALWDKLMGFLVLLLAPTEYERFCKSKSKKNCFRKIAQGATHLSDEFVSSLENMLLKFDNEFRTPEAHGTGVLRKYSFTMQSMHQNPQIELVGYWNLVNDFISKIGGMFKQNKNSKKSSLTNKD